MRTGLQLIMWRLASCLVLGSIMANGSNDPVPKEYQTCDVLVLGAGLSGLNSAWELVQHRPSTRVCVLEAEDRVGGRTKDHHVTGCNNSVVELGAQWIAQESIDTDVWNLAVRDAYILGQQEGWVVDPVGVR